MKTKTRVLWGALLGAVIVVAGAWSSVGYGEEPVREYYESGKVKREATFKNGKPEGTVKAYYENGQVQAAMVLRNGKPEGIATEYYANGQLKSEVVFQNGKPVGVVKKYDEKGKETKVYIENGRIKS